jgi:hypothetical protein
MGGALPRVGIREFVDETWRKQTTLQL